MVTKEQCIIEKILEEIDYGRNGRLVQSVLAAYNQGKQHAGDKVFKNDENGLDAGLQGYSPSFIVLSLIGEDAEYNANDPFFVFENGIRSIDTYDFRRMLKPEDVRRILSEGVIEQLDESDVCDAFEEYLRVNYPQAYRSFNFDALNGYNVYDLIRANWDELANGNNVNEGMAVRLSESDIKNMTNRILKEVLDKIGGKR